MVLSLSLSLSLSRNFAQELQLFIYKCEEKSCQTSNIVGEKALTCVFVHTCLRYKCGFIKHASVNNCRLMFNPFAIYFQYLGMRYNNYVRVLGTFVNTNVVSCTKWLYFLLFIYCTVVLYRDSQYDITLWYYIMVFKCDAILWDCIIISDKEIMISVALVCLSVCLLATVLKRLYTDSSEILWRGLVVMETSD